MTSYRERWTAPVSWWVSVLVFAAVCGWIVLVPTTASIGAVAAAVAGLVAGVLVWSYGSIVVEAGPDGLRVGSALLPARHIGSVQVLDHRSFRENLGPRADARAFLRTRPYIETGLRVEVADPADPTPYWLVSSRRPAAVAEALGHTGEKSSATTTTTNGDEHGGEEDQEEV